MKTIRPKFELHASFYPLVVAFLMLLNLGCKKSPTEPNTTASLSVEDITCTEVWVKITTTNYQTPNTLTLFVNDKADQSIMLVSSDTLLYVDSLLPNRSYKIKAAFATNNQQQTTNEVIATTMDTTSHNFTWQTFTFGGETGSSTLFDVAIIDENNIWAVGEIYMNDSLGIPDPIAYNAVHWDGKEWEVKKISVEYKGNQTVAPLEGVFALPNNQIIFSSGLPYLPQSNGWKLYHLWDMGVLNQDDGGVSKIWGTSINDLYFVGRKGTIVHYDGKSWQRIESGTTMDFYDIYSADGNNVYVSGGDFQNTEGVLLKGDKTGFNILKEGKNINEDEVFKPYFAGVGKTVWESNKNTVLFGGNLLYKYKLGGIGFVKSLQGNYFKENVHGEYFGFISMVRGNAENDVILAGEGNTIRHFNGSTWQQLGLPYDFNSDYTWLAVAMKNNFTITVGRSTSKAIIMVLKR